MPGIYTWSAPSPATPAVPVPAAIAPMAPPVIQGFGTDINFPVDPVTGAIDLDPYFAYVSGNECLIQAISRRLTVPSGGLFYDGDYGTDVRDLENAALTSADSALWQNAISSELTKDERIQDAGTTVTAGLTTGQLISGTVAQPAPGPYQYTAPVSQVTQSFLDYVNPAVWQLAQLGASQTGF